MKSGVDFQWCCEPFKNAFTRGPNRGFNAGVTESDDVALFWRPIEPGDEHLVRETKLPYTMSLVAECVILFCPWCGRNLRKAYRRQLEKMRELSKGSGLVLQPVSTSGPSTPD